MRKAHFYAILNFMETKQYKKVKVSLPAYKRIKEIASKSIYKGRGIVGVIDEAFLGKFTTTGSGRKRYTSETEKKEQKS